ncbi:DNA mismatch repair protein Msh3 [Talaromyces proteolyticus]|uniref:ATP phosphoribosyltransferase n=1 Tax=Talaromyces proteolyticus TaxID=1131652 RepID=A0AAD4L3D6_9EURO|nr:DNA mismatch repair protein Msh3 [Talaromyces proteolyticus]KAH8703468.1 DNA mismatch repair protein Msh3 [Talaromyces proteolyticus]
MPSQSSPPSSSPALKRKQQTISSFFTKKPSTTERKPSDETNTNEAADAAKRVLSGKENSLVSEQTAQHDEERDDIVLPPPKRVKATVDESIITTSRKDADLSKLSQSSVRTDRFKFTSSPAVVEDRLGEEDGLSRKEKDKMHQKFVKKLGGADCLIGISKTSSGGDDNAAAGEEDAEEDEEPAPAPVAKGKATKKGGSKLTPMEKQVIDIKRKHMDTLLVVEVGYKFRFFGEDARTAAKELSIVCIPGKMRFDEHPSEAHLDRFASASIPTHRLHVHVKRLVSAGHKVGVVRQLETAALKAAGDNRNAPFVRKLTNVYTKGTYIDDVEGLSGPTAALGGATPATGYLLCITESNTSGSDERVHVGIVAVQPATGDIIYDEFEDGFMRGEIETRLLHIAPCEILIVGELSKPTEKLVKHLSGSKMNVFGDKVRVERQTWSKSAAAEAHNRVTNFYADKMKSAGGTGDLQANALLEKVLQLPDQVTVCLSSMIDHLSEYGLEHVFDLTKYFQSFSARSHMLLNGNTLTSLEIYQNQTDYSSKGSLFWTMDRTRTRFGQRMLRKWVGRPLLDKSHLEERVGAVEELLSSEQHIHIEKLKDLLGKVKTDLERSLIRIYYGKCTRPELLTVLQTLQMITTAFSHITAPSDTGFQSSLISQAVAALPTIQEDVVHFLDKINMHAAKNDDKYEFFRESEENDGIMEQKLGIASVEHDLGEHRSVIAETLGKKKVDYATSAGIEYLIEVENNSPQIKRVPASWAKISGTKRLSRFHTPEVVRLLRQRDQHKEALAAACDKAYKDLLADISAKYQSFRDCIQALALLDCLFSLAAIANQPGYTKPEFTDETCITVEQGRHPMVEQLLMDTYVPNDTSLDANGTRALLVTGPNMGGKSSYVRQVALIAIMGQIGSYVPAKSAKLGMLDAVFTRMGAFDNMLNGESTFMVELSETADILKQATPRSLVILDELGRGTSTHDGVAIAQAVLDYMVRSMRSLTLFITHYQHLSAMAKSYSNNELRNVHMRFTECGDRQDAEITFLYEVGEGVAHRSYGLNVARLANLPSSVLDVAKEKSSELEEKIRRKRLAAVVKSVDEILTKDISGRLQQTTLDLLSGCDIQFRRETRLDIALVKNLPIALIFLPAADIPTFVGEGRVDIGITGRDQVGEHDANLASGEASGVTEVLDLGFGGCKLQVQVPEKGEIKQAKELVGKNVVTSFTALATRFFAQIEGVSDQSQLKTKIKYVGGSVEAACALGVADGIVDLVESGETMKAAGLKAIDTVVESTAVLIKSNNTKHELTELIASRIRGVIAAQKYVLCQYNINRDQLASASVITPGKRAPTITALEAPNWVAVSAMVEKKKIATVMDELTKVGATDILVLKIENTRTD